MSIAMNIMRELPNEICCIDGVFSVDADPWVDKSGIVHLDIELDEGRTFRLSLTEVTE